MPIGLSTAADQAGFSLSFLKGKHYFGSFSSQQLVFTELTGAWLGDHYNFVKCGWSCARRQLTWRTDRSPAVHTNFAFLGSHMTKCRGEGCLIQHWWCTYLRRRKSFLVWDVESGVQVWVLCELSKCTFALLFEAHVHVAASFLHWWKHLPCRDMKTNEPLEMKSSTTSLGLVVLGSITDELTIILFKVQGTRF